MTVLRQVKIWDDSRGPAGLDAATNVMETIEYEHHEIHSGSSYHAYANAAGGSGTKATITFTTPDTLKWAHVVVSGVSNVIASFTFGEGATVTSPTGSDFVPRNRNRNSDNVSGMISSGSAGGAGNVTTGATVTDFGTILQFQQMGAGKVGGESRGAAEWVLKRNTTYALECESQAATSEVHVNLEWYEHTDKNVIPSVESSSSSNSSSSSSSGV